MRVLETLSDLTTWRLGQVNVGFVPTMGALHQGHLSLVKKAKEQTANVVVSIFVNPTQFNDKEDFEKYPRTTEQDLKLLEQQGVDAVWLPLAKELYPYEPAMKITEQNLSRQLCGAHRPGHFDGVLTVVMKLFQLVQPDKAFFGEKDFQQLLLIRRMAEEFFLDVEVVSVPTKREESGLAMSSRNQRLSATDREKAALIYRALKSSPSAEAAKALLEKEDFKVEYVEDLMGRRFAAAWVGGVRLIDNVEV
jgi:pantoate--beta-alanine ligase